MNLTIQNGRFLTLNTVIRVNQIEARRDLLVGNDEHADHTVEKVRAFREAVAAGFPGGKITWSISWHALCDDSEQYKAIREQIKAYHHRYGDDVTYIPGAYFSNAYSTREEVNTEIHEGLQKVSGFMGNGFRPQSIVAGFLSAENQKYLADVEGIHVCQGNIFSQYAIDNQDGDGAPCYPFYPSAEHFCKPAQNAEDFIDCVNLDGWTVDFLAARREGASDEQNSRMGVGPIETLQRYSADIGLQQMLATTAVHFDTGHAQNSFAWVTNNWEISLISWFGMLDCLTKWLSAIRERWPDVQMPTQGEFGALWRKAYPDNSRLDYRFTQTGTGIGGSDADKELHWYMNQHFRLAFLKDINSGAEEVIDFTRYDIPAQEPQTITRQWSLLGQINQKQTRPQDKPVPYAALNESDRAFIETHYTF